MKRRQGVLPTIFENNLEKFVPTGSKIITKNNFLTSPTNMAGNLVKNDIEVYQAPSSIFRFVTDIDQSNQTEWSEETEFTYKLDDMIEVVDDDYTQIAQNELEKVCRLCALPFLNEVALPIFNIPNHEVAKTIEQLLPNQIAQDDGKPQAICVPCWNKAQSCLVTIYSFKIAQNHFES